MRFKKKATKKKVIALYVETLHVLTIIYFHKNMQNHLTSAKLESVSN